MAEKNDAAKELSRIMSGGRAQRVSPQGPANSRYVVHLVCSGGTVHVISPLWLWSVLDCLLLQREGFSKFNKIYEFDFNILGMVGACCWHGDDL